MHFVVTTGLIIKKVTLISLLKHVVKNKIKIAIKIRIKIKFKLKNKNLNLRKQ